MKINLSITRHRIALCTVYYLDAFSQNKQTPFSSFLVRYFSHAFITKELNWLHHEAVETHETNSGRGVFLRLEINGNFQKHPHIMYLCTMLKTRCWKQPRIKIRDTIKIRESIEYPFLSYIPLIDLIILK